jgi:hypothetical protein
MTANVSPPPTPPTWPLWRRLLFRAGVVDLGLYFLIFGQLLWPGLAGVRHALAELFARLLGQTLPPLIPTGSGDTAQDWALTLLNASLSLLLGMVWTIIQPRDPSPRQLAGLSLGLRVALVFWLYQYGSIKFNFGQFGLLPAGVLNDTYGDSTPMGLLWRFMGASPSYQWVAGVAEVLPALLLLHRRTVTLGALVAAVTLTNVLALNLAYDVPVKLFSFHLLLAAMVLALLDHARLHALVAGRALPAQVWPPRSPRLHRWAVAGSWLLTLLALGQVASSARQGLTALRLDRQQTRLLPTPLKTTGFHWITEHPDNR